MKAHRSLSRKDILCYAPDHIALMVASEFFRASNRASNTTNVLNCYARARELMGILETLPLPEATAVFLQPFYSECCEEALLADDRLQPEFVQLFGQRLAEAFTSAAEQLSKGLSHA